MKRSVFSLLFVLVIGSLQAVNSHFPNQNLADFTKEINKSFDVGENATISIDNKFGSVDVKTDAVNKAEFHIQIIVKTNKKSKADEVLKRISVDFDHSGNSVSAETQINSSETWWKKLFGSSKVEYEINYEVRIPKSSKLELSNKYGNSVVGSLNNNLDAEIKYGNLEFDKIDGNVDLELGYGKLTGVQCNSMDADIAYSSEFKLQSVHNLDIESKYSKIFIDDVGDADIHSGYDEYSIGTIGNLDNSGKYDDFKIKNAGSVDFDNKQTNIVIGNLERDIEINMKYGKLVIDKVSPSVSEIDVETEYVDVSLTLFSDFLFEADLKYVNFDQPNDFSGNHEIERQKQVYDGSVGSNSANTSISTIMKYGALIITKK